MNWGDESTFDFCFLGIPKGSTVAVSTYMVSAHDNRADQKEFFLKGYREMLSRIEPERILCYHTPFPEMEGNIVYIDYELSSWKYQADYKPSPYVKYITGELPLPQNSGIIVKRNGWLMPLDKGTGSAYGGKWRPSKPEDERLIGKPGEIKITYDKSGYKRETKIGDDGRAVLERHHTDHNQPWAHSNPHDHKINWESPRYGIPNFEKPHINYTADHYPDGVPEFKCKGVKNMNCLWNSYEDDRFKTISEFKECLIRGGEVEFDWKGSSYSITHYNEKIAISEANKQETEVLCDTADEVLEYMVCGDRLRDVVTQILVESRSF